MCGIFGILSTNSQYHQPDLLKKINNKLRHRGPDDTGFLSYNSSKKITTSVTADSHATGILTLMHRRLSILDLSKLGWQPMVSFDNQYAIVFNGEIYNFIEIKEELIKKGYIFKSHSDTEVLLNAYHAWGEKCLNKLIGMFSFCILDLKKEILFCVRDFFGIKPFYYYLADNIFCFASEPQVILEIPGIHSKANLQRVFEYLIYGQQETTNTSFFEGIKQLPPSHYMTISLSDYKKINIHQYWHIDLTNKSTLDYSSATKYLKSLFEKSVQMHLRSDVKVAANLSGGIDSSAIVMMVKKYLSSGLDLQTISYIAEEKNINEEKWIDIVNKASHSIPCKIKPSSDDLIDDLNELVRVQGEPVGSSSAFAQFRVFQAIKKLGIKVVLDGQGADELLAGYRSYLFAYLESLIKNKNFFNALPFMFNVSKLPNMISFKNLLLLAKGYKNKLLPSSNILPNIDDVVGSFPQWINGQVIKSNNLSPFQSWTAKTNYKMKEQLHYTFVEQSLPVLLRIADRNSMAFSIESRLPFLTPQLAQFVFSLPENYIIDNKARTKAIFRDSMKDIVPAEILSRKDKIGFSTPEETWLRINHEWVTTILNSETAHSIPFFEHKKLIQEWSEFSFGRSNFDWRFWRWINLIQWSKCYNVKYE
ncbi:MAG: hypothetical protein JWM09_1320 [Francisellaceae bacterium]|nr:hypothetical protein [Francisellaceae bacterium]